jgi:23S rRNA pseudouridine2605 synthase
VKLGEETLTTPNTVLPNLKGVTVDGKAVKAPSRRACSSSTSPRPDHCRARSRRTPDDLHRAAQRPAPGTPRLMPIGRLDFNTEGLLLLTNDGELKRAMELPSSGVPRTYRARTFGASPRPSWKTLIEGIEIDGVRYGPIDANLERSTGRNQWIELTITEGKNREVRRVLEHLGLEVSRLIRTSYGPFELLDLPRGQAVEIRQARVEKFRKGLKGPASPAAPRPAWQRRRQARARVRRSSPRKAPRA